MEVVFIAALGYSGSTVLDLLLGEHPRFVGLGEVFSLLRPGADYLSRTAETVCSCGSVLDKCSFWGPACTYLKQSHVVDDQDRMEKYTWLLGRFKETFGEGCIPVDSSKGIPALQMLLDLPDVQPKVLYLIRDVRAWAVSRNDNSKRREEYRSWNVKQWVKRTSLYRFRQWYLGNRRIQNFLTKSGVPSFQLGYEELCLYPDLMVSHICEFLGVEPDDSMFDISNSGSHVALGNRMRSQGEKRRRIFYNNRWFYRNDWMLPAVVSQQVMRYNVENVYRNTRDILWNR